VEDTYSVGPLIKGKSLSLGPGPNRVGVFLTSSEDGNRSNFLHVVLFNFLNAIQWTQSINHGRKSFRIQTYGELFFIDDRHQIGNIEGRRTGH
jgi:ABC-type Fe2+-enterobactin transport system substrate-binding protein